MIVNMNKPLSPTKPTQIAKGPDIDKFDIRKPKIPPVPPPRNWQREQLYYSEPRADYNMFGNYEINFGIGRSQHRAMNQMHKDMHMLDLVNQLRGK